MSIKYIAGIILAKIAMLTLVFSTTSKLILGIALFGAIGIALYKVFTINKNVNDPATLARNNAKTRLLMSVSTLMLIPLLFLKAEGLSTAGDAIAYYALSGMLVLQYLWTLYMTRESLKSAKRAAERAARWAREDAELEAEREKLRNAANEDDSNT